MGKTKKPTSNEKEEGQKKISSFFQKASQQNVGKSTLFKEIGNPSKVKPTKTGAHSVTTEANPVVLSDSEEFLDIKDKNKASARARKHLSSLENGHVREKPETLKEKHHVKSEIQSVQHDPMIVPETQFDLTPKGKGGKTYQATDIHDFKSPASDRDLDSSIVPDTPENVKTDPVRKKRQFGRSCLLSSMEIGSNPIQKAKENREAKAALKKKQLSAARKGLVSVSINVNNKEHKEQRDNAMPAQDPSHPHSIADADDNVTGVTPTKVCENGYSLKRMAKSGVSPDAKRNSTSGNIENDENSSANFTVMKSLNFENQKDTDTSSKSEETNRNEIYEMNRRAAAANYRLEQKRMERMERIEKEKQEKIQKQKELVKEERKKNGMKIMNYQLHGDTGMSKFEDKTVKDDDVLDNILDELNSPKVVGDKKIQNQGGTAEKAPKQPLKKRYSLEKVLKIGTNSLQNDKSNVKDSSTKSGNKANDLIEKLNAEWTADDEALMKEIDKSFDIDCKLDKETCDKLSLTSSDKSHVINAHIKTETDIGVANNKDIKSDIRFFKDPVNLQRTKHKMTVNERRNSASVSPEIGGSNLKSGVKSDNPEQMIVDLTPAMTREVESDFGDEAEIDEYMTQFDNQAICDKIQQLTPFKEKSCKREETQQQYEAPCVKYGRHIVSNVERQRDHLMLEVLSWPEEKKRRCRLYGNWQDTHVSPGDVVHILADFTNDECEITDQSGFIIVNPDLLLSGTTVVGSLFCMRRSILKEKFKGCEKGNLQMLYGSILHSVFQEVLRKQLTDDKILEEATKIVKQTENLMQIYANDVTEEKVMEEVKTYIPQIQTWMKQYTNIGGTGNKRQSDAEILVTKVNDIEENIWSPRLGIKGKIDLTVNVFKKGETRQTTLPLELKTGRASYSIEHKGQVTLYSMMSADRRLDPGRGLLLYLKEPSMKIIPADQPSKAGLIQLRNEMAYYISRQVVKSSSESGPTYTLGTLPDPISNLRACEKCPQLLNCAIYHRDVEARPVGTDGKGRLIQESLSHLTMSHIQYYKHWSLMLDLETQTDRAKKTLADTWCLNAADREGLGACLSCMVIKTNSFTESDTDVTFIRHGTNTRSIPICSIGPVESDSVVISCESLSWVAVCTGFIKHVYKTEVQILIDREGVERLYKLKEETFRIDHCDRFSTAGILIEGVERLYKLKDETFRIDHCDSFSTAGIFYTNISLLLSNEAKFEVLRSLIIDRSKPEFQNTLSKTNIEKVKGIFKTLNKPQKTAILKVLMSKHYVLIRGYPGTGKTSTIVAIVKVLNILGLSVLLTSYTHSAVDNILLKLKKDNIQFMRLGRISKVHAGIRDRCAEVLTKNITSVEGLKTFYNSQMIIATSCLGTNHAMFTHRRFDVCIIDEASQVLQPACLGPLFCSDKFVLVGDSKQLPPVVQSRDARTSPIIVMKHHKCYSGLVLVLIIATSCLGTNHAMFTHRRFDVCIIDEASQVLQPACLGPLFCSDKFVLVGDSKQLPPVVQSREARFDVCIIDEASQVLQPACLGPLFCSDKFVLVGDSKQLPLVVQSREARDLGMDESLFVRLDGLGATFGLNLQYRINGDLGMDESLFVRLDGLGATFDLNLQYRMNSEIMSISNKLIYNNCLKCGTDDIANRVLTLPDTSKYEKIIEDSPWLCTVLDCQLNKSVVFLNTQHIPAPEYREKGGIIRNETEANIVKTIVTALLEVGLDSDDIGVIAPYRSQVFYIRNVLHEGQGHMSHVEVNTVDQYQGRDKSVIIISFVRSSGEKEGKKTGELLNDIRRLNVAMTRAKCKLVMIGNIPVLQQYPPLREIIELSISKQQIFLQVPLDDD